MVSGPWPGSKARPTQVRGAEIHCLSYSNKGLPCGSAGKEAVCNVGDLDSSPELGRSPGEGKGYSLQYSGLENSVDCIIHGVTKSLT